MDKLDGVAINWKTFGLYLNPHLHERLNEIEVDYKKCFDCLRETIVCWLTRTTDPNSVDLINALNKIRENKLAHDIQQEISQGNNNIPLHVCCQCKIVSVLVDTCFLFLLYNMWALFEPRPRPNFPLTLM